MAVDKDKEKYRNHKSSATYRGIPFLLTFKEWLNIWNVSGHYHERGNKSGQYCMSRYGDMGSYVMGNVFIQLHSANTGQAHKGIPVIPVGTKRPPMSQEQRVKISNTLAGRKLSNEHKTNISLGSLNKKPNSPQSYAKGWAKRKGAL